MPIEIKEPCKEDWSKMTATDQGAFCKACAKEVIDFTGMTSTEIKTQLALHYSPTTSICGRIRNHQLAELNDDFYAWKSEKERFNTVWIFSLIAVFGLTLFSCQNTLTKEMVHQMEVSGVEMMDGEREELVGMELLKVDTEIEVTEESGECVAPDSNLRSDGIIDLVHWATIPFDGECIATMGFMIMTETLHGNLTQIVSGAITSSDAIEERSWPSFLEAYVPLPLLPEPPSLHVNPNPNAHQNNQSTVLNDKDDDFEIALHPLPIDESSRLLVKTESALTVEISLEHRESNKTTYSGEIHIPKGTFSIDLKLSELLSGNYTLEVSSRSHTHEIEFSSIYVDRIARG